MVSPPKVIDPVSLNTDGPSNLSILGGTIRRKLRHYLLFLIRLLCQLVKFLLHESGFSFTSTGEMMSFVM
jgi:hypothetical protein